MFNIFKRKPIKKEIILEYKIVKEAILKGEENKRCNCNYKVEDK